MYIAVFSDSHDNLLTLHRGLAELGKLGITYGLHLGDYCAPFVLEELAKSGIKWSGVWGNNDGDKLLGYRIVEKYGTVDLAPGDFRELEVANRKLFLTHYPEIARLAALSGQYDAVFYGHNHQKSQEIVGSTLLANPGELCGMRTGSASFGIYDTEKNEFTLSEV